MALESECRKAVAFDGIDLSWNGKRLCPTTALACITSCPWCAAPRSPNPLPRSLFDVLTIGTMHGHTRRLKVCLEHSLCLASRVGCINIFGKVESTKEHDCILSIVTPHCLVCRCILQLRAAGQTDQLESERTFALHLQNTLTPCERAGRYHFHQSARYQLQRQPV